MTIAFVVVGVAVGIDLVVTLVVAVDTAVALAADVDVVADIGIVVPVGAADTAADLAADTVDIVPAVAVVVVVAVVGAVAAALIGTDAVVAAALTFDPVVGVLGAAERRFLETCTSLVVVVGAAHVPDPEFETEFVVDAEVGIDAADIAQGP